MSPKNTWASRVAQMVNSLPVVQETGVRSLGREEPLEKAMATHSSTLAWKIPWMEEPGSKEAWYSPCGSKESDTTEQLHFPKNAHILRHRHSASVTAETVTEDAARAGPQPGPRSANPSLPSVQDPGSGPGWDPSALCPSPASCGLHEAEPAVLHGVLQSELFMLLLRSREAAPSGRLCALVSPPPGGAHTGGLSRSRGRCARLSEPLLPVVRQWYLSLRRWLPVLQPLWMPRPLCEVACISGHTGALWTTWPPPRFLSVTADSDSSTLMAPWRDHRVLGTPTALPLSAGALSGQAPPPVMGTHCSLGTALLSDMGTRHDY
ncbi:LYR motif-containing protein 4 isoform X1 [Moschus berezovskii]|uniref:LYR motif-containing protein 4 isoform X1 n=1 Tax=Moschus berezovskii TaxID=68408 RepID=UPI002443D31C|nr:LYR motif-containing protein 4 isoform X1 [Moschus berezovskii]